VHAAGASVKQQSVCFRQRRVRDLAPARNNPAGVYHAPIGHGYSGITLMEARRARPPFE
jgi:hypothetical protein